MLLPSVAEGLAGLPARRNYSVLMLLSRYDGRPLVMTANGNSMCPNLRTGDVTGMNEHRTGVRQRTESIKLIADRGEQPSHLSRH
jgi:hypothetical protein